MKPHLKKSITADIENSNPCEPLMREPGRAIRWVLEGAAQIHYLRNAALRLDPWTMVWQSMHGASSADPAFIP